MTLNLQKRASEYLKLLMWTIFYIPFSLVAELHIKNHQFYKSNGLYANKSHISISFKKILTECKKFLHCEGYDYEENPENLLKGPFFTRRMKLYSRPDGFML